MGHAVLVIAGHGFALQPLVTTACALLGLLHLLAVRRAAAHGVRTSRRRSALFLGGLSSLVAVSASPLVGAQRTLFWPLAVVDVLLLTLLPLPFVLSRPGALWQAARKGPSRAVPARVLNPLVGSLLSVLVLGAFDGSPLLLVRLRHPALLTATQVALLLTGCLFFGALLDTRGAGRTSYPARALVAFVDGLLDALPGLVVLGSGDGPAAAWYRPLVTLHGPSPAADVRIAGTAMVALSELVGLPSLLVLLVLWARDDQTQAQRIDAHLDLPDADRPRWDESTQDRPWWEADPGPLSGRQGFRD